MICHWVHRLTDSVSNLPTAQPSRVVIDETAVRIDGDWFWVYDAIRVDSRHILDVAVFGRRGTNRAAAFLHQLTEKLDLFETAFLVDGYGYLASFLRLELSGQLDYIDRSRIEKGFHTLTMRVNRFYNSWVGSWVSACECLDQFEHYYNAQ